jgi:hypothetical protein
VKTHLAKLFGHLLAPKYVMNGRSAHLGKKYHKSGEYKDLGEKILAGPVALQITLAVQKNFPPGQV